MSEEIVNPSLENDVQETPAETAAVVEEPEVGSVSETVEEAQTPAAEVATEEPAAAAPEPVALAQEPATELPVVAEAPVVAPEPAAAAEEPASEPVTSPPAEPIVAPEPIVAQEPVETPSEDAGETAQPTLDAASGQTAEDYASSFPTLSKGEVIKGTVVHIDREGVLVDVGAKSEGIIHLHELSRNQSAQAEDVVTVGEEIDVLVMEAESADGNLILSKKRADFEKAWDRVLEAKESGKVITAMVTDRVKGGLVVDLGIRGFVPASHVGSGSLKTNLDCFVGQTLDLKVIEVDKERRKVVLSNRDAKKEEDQRKRHETVAALQVGQIRRGIVRRLTTYGAFVDLGGIDGLLHISEMSWTRINQPSDVLKEGQEIDVLVLKLDLEHGRVSLGRRQILPDPWSEVQNAYRVGEIITGTVARIVPFGAFVQVKGGVEGIIPNSELSYRRGVKAGDLIHQGAEIEVKVIDLRPEERKLTLSLRQARQEEDVRRERKVVEDFQTRPEREAPRYTIGDAMKAREDSED